LFTDQLTVNQARDISLECLRTQRIAEAECYSNAVLGKFPNDSVANFVHGMVALHYGHFGYSITLFKNALRANPQCAEASQALDDAISKVSAFMPEGICVLGDSHTGVFRPIQDATVIWVGPVTMYRVGREGAAFLNYKDFGVSGKNAVVSVFGEIDIRAHFMKRSDGSARSIADNADKIVGRYLRTLLENSKNSHVRQTIIASVVPPYREGAEVNHESVGTISERVAATVAVNDRLRFGSQLLGFGFLDLYTNFVDDAGTLAKEFTEDGIHIHPRNALVVAQELRKIL